MNPRTIPWLAALFVVACTLAAYLNSLDGEFLSDDFCEILDNPRMDSLWPPWRVMFEGHELPSRPLPYLTFAIDHAVWGEVAVGYHITNLAIHVTAALALFFLARSAISSPRLRPAFGEHADILAALIASAWGAHPLNTQAVTYIYQRMESMTAMLCLVSLAAFAGAVVRQWNVRWLTASVLASAAAMFSKETAVVLPLLIASYDWLLCGEHPCPPTRRRWFYTALFSTWILILVQLLAQSHRYDATGAYDVSPVSYFLTQPRVILQYLRLSLWPSGLCFDRAMPLMTAWSEILPSLVYVVALGLLVVYGLIRRTIWAWPGVAFFLALAPSSSILPLGAVTEEYRMYLALAAVVSFVVLGGYALIIRCAPAGRPRSIALRWSAGLSLAAVLILIVLTQQRNRVYATPGGVWLDVIEKGRGGTRTYWNIALACDMHDGIDVAMRYADEVCRLNDKLDVYEHLATRRLGKGDAATAVRYLRHAVETQADAIAKGDVVPVRAAAYLVMILSLQGNHEEAEVLAADYLGTVRSALGDDHLWTSELMAIHAGGLLRAGDAKAAELFARKAYESQRRARDEGDRKAGTAGATLARILRQQGRDAEALEIERSP